MDGTLIDSMWVWEQIDREFLSARGLALKAGMHKEIEGMSFRETACYFKEHFHLDEDITDIMNTWNQMAFDKYANEIRLKDGVLDFLTFLKSNGIKMGIATSNAKELVDVCLKALGIDTFFDAVTTSAEIEHGKPDPDIYLKTADKLSVQPSDCLVFEDVVMGILAGKRAGMQVCAVDDAYSRHCTEQKKELADYFINSFEELRGMCE